MARQQRGGGGGQDDVTVRVEGLGRLRRELRAFQGDVEELKDANAAAASIVAAAAAPRAPRRSGTLSGSGRGNRAAGRASVTFGGARVPYAGPIHWGWPSRGIDGDPFIVEAAQATEQVWLAAYSRDLQAAADKVRGDGGL